MRCENPICKKEEILLFKIKTGFYVCENCALISGMNKKQTQEIGRRNK